jgi:hypothetical protein
VEKPEDSTRKSKWVGRRITLKWILKICGSDDVDWIHLAGHRNKWRVLPHDNEPSVYKNAVNLVTS